MSELAQLLKRAALPQLLAQVAAELATWRGERESEWSARFTKLNSEQLSSRGRAARRVELLEARVREDINKHIEIYVSIFDRSGNKDLLSPQSLADLSENMMTTVALRFAAVKDANARDQADGYPALGDECYEESAQRARSLILAHSQKLRSLGGLAHGEADSNSRDRREAPALELHTPQFPIGSEFGARRIEPVMPIDELVNCIETWRLQADEDGGKLNQTVVAEQIGINDRAYRAAKAGKPKAKDHYSKLAKFAEKKGLLPGPKTGRK